MGEREEVCILPREWRIVSMECIIDYLRRRIFIRISLWIPINRIKLCMDTAADYECISVAQVYQWQYSFGGQQNSLVEWEKQHTCCAHHRAHLRGRTARKALVKAWLLVS